MVGYTDLVDEARACVDEVEVRGWRLAELCWQAKHEHGKSYAQFARDVGQLSRSGVHHYAQVWANREEEHGSFADAFAREISSVEQQAELKEYAAERGIAPASARTELAFSRRAVAKGPAPLAAELARAALARPEVREQLAADDAAAEELHDASSDVYNREDHRAGHDRSRVVKPQGNEGLERSIGEMEIRVALHKLVQLAQRLGLEGYLIEQMEESRQRLEISIAAGNPKEAVAELERWLAAQGEEA